MPPGGRGPSPDHVVYDEACLPSPARERALPSCQCALFGDPCVNAITQEDLLCDACRAGCMLLVAHAVPAAGMPREAFHIPGIIVTAEPS